MRHFVELERLAIVNGDQVMSSWTYPELLNRLLGTFFYLDQLLLMGTVWRLRRTIWIYPCSLASYPSLLDSLPTSRSSAYPPRCQAYISYSCWIGLPPWHSPKPYYYVYQKPLLSPVISYYSSNWSIPDSDSWPPAVRPIVVLEIFPIPPIPGSVLRPARISVRLDIDYCA